MNPLHAVSTENAGQPRAPRRACSSVPQLGNTRSGVVVPNTMKSISAGVDAGRLDGAARRHFRRGPR